MTNKMTQRDYFNEIIALAEINDRADLVEFAKGRIEVLDNKAKNKKATKTPELNETLKNEIKNILSTDGMTISDIQAKSDVLADLSNQKMSALLRQLCLDGVAEKTMDKKKAFFTLKG